MFSGLVEARVEVRSWTPVGTGGRLVLPAPAGGGHGTGGEPWQTAVGDSIAVSGCCLTVSRLFDPAGGEAEVPDGTPGAAMEFELSSETLSRTWFGDRLAPGCAVNLERSLRLADRLGGHLVSGHVDACGEVVRVDDSGDGGRSLTFEVPEGFERYLVEKGSVGIDGISLTVVEPTERRFHVAVIPVTLDVTTLGLAEVGTPVHLEADMIGKWVERMMVPR